MRTTIPIQKDIDSCWAFCAEDNNGGFTGTYGSNSDDIYLQLYIYIINRVGAPMLRILVALYIRYSNPPPQFWVHCRYSEEAVVATASQCLLQLSLPLKSFSPMRFEIRNQVLHEVDHNMRFHEIGVH